MTFALSAPGLIPQLVGALDGALLLRCRQAPAIAAAYGERLGALS